MTYIVILCMTAYIAVKFIMFIRNKKRAKDIVEIDNLLIESINRPRS